MTEHRLLAFRPDVILSSSTANLTTLQRLSPTAPIVFLQVSDPVAQGFVVNWPALSLLRRAVEISQVRRRLVLPGGHQEAVAAVQVIVLLADDDVVVVLVAIVLEPDDVIQNLNPSRLKGAVRPVTPRRRRNPRRCLRNPQSHRRNRRHPRPGNRRRRPALPASSRS